MNDAASKGDERVEAVEGDAVLNTAVTAASGAMDTEVDTASGGDTGGSVDNTANSGETDTSPDQDITADSKPTVETSEDSAANSNEEEASEPSPAVVDSVADDPAPDETAAAVEEEPNSWTILLALNPQLSTGIKVFVGAGTVSCIGTLRVESWVFYYWTREIYVLCGRYYKRNAATRTKVTMEVSSNISKFSGALSDLA